jgi:sec-independent protein translocase protein TatA
MILLLGMPGGPELILIAFIVLLLFGGRKLPELMKGLGKGIREFNNAKNSIQSEINTEMKELEKPKIEVKEEVKVTKEKIKEE